MNVARAVRQWSFLRLVLVCAAWFAFTVGAVVAFAAISIYRISGGVGSGGIGAVSSVHRFSYFLPYGCRNG